MNTMRLVMVAVVAGLAGLGARADEKKDIAKLIVGKWEATKADEGTLPVGSMVEFTKDGKLKVSVKDSDMTLEGTYKIEGNKFHMTMKVGDDEHKQTINIKKITENELSTSDNEGKVVELKRKK